MKRILFLPLVILIGVVIALTLVSPKAAGQKNKFRRSVDPVAGRYIVVLGDKPGGFAASSTLTASAAAELVSEYGGTIDDVYFSSIEGYSSAMTEKEARALSDDERVQYVEEDSLVSTAETQLNAGWSLDRVDQRNLPLNGSYNYTASGAGVNAYIIDTGIRRTHVDFGGRADAVFDSINDGQNGSDCNGHGTHVAGTVGSTTYGVAKGVNLHAVRVLDCSGYGPLSGVVAGVDWVTANRIDPAVANISMIFAGSSPTLETAITNSIASGVTYAVAAGNSNADACSFTPSRVPNALTVGASDLSDVRSTYSNYGSCVDLFAPGTMILSTGIASDTATLTLSGTSMASPMVAGAAALYLQSNPSASPSAVAQAIKASATLGALTTNNAASSDLLLYSQLTSQPPPTPTPSPSPMPTPTTVITVKKQVSNVTGTSSTVAFPYVATHLAATNFSLTANTDYLDPNVQTQGVSTAVSVRETPVPGWQLVSIGCIESAGNQDTTVDLANGTANIVAQPGESITCTFTSSPLSPTAADVSVSGRVVDPYGIGVGGVELSLFDTTTGESTPGRSSPFGYYRFDGVTGTHTFVLIAYSAKRYSIVNNTRVFSLTDSISDVDFMTSGIWGG